MTYIEALAAISGLLCVWLTIGRNILCWPTGLVQVVLYVWVFWQTRLYSDMGLNVIYIFLQFYGWWAWLHGGKDKKELPLSEIGTGRNLRLWLAACLAGTVVLGYFMLTYAKAAAPYPDAFIATTSLIATYLMARKKVESWWFWIAVDVVGIGVYAYKGLYITSGLYAIFLILAIGGYMEWRKVFRKEDTLHRLINSADGQQKLAEVLTGGN